MTALKKFSFDRRPYAAEFIGTFVFVFMGAGSVMTAAYMGFSGAGAAVLIALAHGLAILTMVWATAPVSGGHLNPAVTFAVWLMREIGFWRAAGYVIAQSLGAMAAAAILIGIIHSLAYTNSDALGAVEAVKLGSPSISGGMILFAFWLELFLTSFLVFVVVRTAVEQKHSSAPVAIGLTVAMSALAFGPLTGAAMNPARSFGPMLVSRELFSGDLRIYLVYFLAPFLGAIVGYGFNKVVSDKKD